MTDAKTEAWFAVKIAAAHHAEVVELMVEESGDFTDALMDAGDCLDVALVIGHDEGIPLFDLWRVSGLPPVYVTSLINGTLAC